VFPQGPSLALMPPDLPPQPGLDCRKCGCSSNPAPPDFLRSGPGWYWWILHPRQATWILRVLVCGFCGAGPSRTGTEEAFCLIRPAPDFRTLLPALPRNMPFPCHKYLRFHTSWCRQAHSSPHISTPSPHAPSIPWRASPDQPRTQRFRSHRTPFPRLPDRKSLSLPGSRRGFSPHHLIKALVFVPDASALQRS